MQKKIIVLALAAAFSAPVFAADTTVYGVADVAVVNMQGSGTKSDTQVVSSGLAGSRLGVKSSEELTDGLKASVVLEYSLDVAKDAGIASARTQMISLSGDFGTVAGGFLATTGYDFSRFDPTGGSAVSPLGNLTKGGAFLIGNEGVLKRAPRALAYISPVMGGVTVAANYTTDVTGGTGNINIADTSSFEKATAYLVSANYSEGAVAAALVYANKNDGTSATGIVGAKTTETAIGASYDLGMAKLSATYQTSKKDTTASGDSDKVLSVSAAAPFGASTIILSYAKATMTAAGTDKDGSGATLAYLNSLSKTTTFYAAYSSMSQGSNSTAFSVNKNALSNISAGSGSSMIAVGLNKKF